MKEIENVLPSHLTEWTEAQKPGPKNTLAKDDFMKLLMTQLSHQDPLNPVDHKEFSTQLAQFSSLEALSNIGTGIQSLKEGMGGEAKLQALGMIGKRVQSSGGEVQLLQGNPVTLSYQTKSDLKPVKVSIYSDQGRVVREMDIDAKQNAKDIKWDGKDIDGNALPTGRYSFRVHGVNNQGVAQDIATEMSGKVTGLEMEGDTPMLLIKTDAGNSKLELSKVTTVQLDEGSSPSQAAPVNPQNIPVKMTGQPLQVASNRAGDEDIDEEDIADALSNLDRWTPQTYNR